MQGEAIGTAQYWIVMLVGFLAGCLILSLLVFLARFFVGIVKFVFSFIVGIVILGFLAPFLLPVLFAISIPILALAPIFFVFLAIPIVIGLALIHGLFTLIFG